MCNILIFFKLLVSSKYKEKGQLFSQRENVYTYTLKRICLSIVMLFALTGESHAYWQSDYDKGVIADWGAKGHHIEMAGMAYTPEDLNDTSLFPNKNYTFYDILPTSAQIQDMDIRFYCNSNTQRISKVRMIYKKTATAETNSNYHRGISAYSRYKTAWNINNRYEFVQVLTKGSTPATRELIGIKFIDSDNSANTFQFYCQSSNPFSSLSGKDLQTLDLKQANIVGFAGRYNANNTQGVYRLGFVIQRDNPRLELVTKSYDKQRLHSWLHKGVSITQKGPPNNFNTRSSGGFYDVAEFVNSDFILEVKCGSGSNVIETISMVERRSDGNYSRVSSSRGGSTTGAKFLRLSQYKTINVTWASLSKNIYNFETKIYGKYKGGASVAGRPKHYYNQLRRVEFVHAADPSKNVVCGTSDSSSDWVRDTHVTEKINLLTSNVIGISGLEESSGDKIKRVAFVTLEHDDANRMQLSLSGSKYYGNFGSTSAANFKPFKLLFPSLITDSDIVLQCDSSKKHLEDIQFKYKEAATGAWKTKAALGADNDSTWNHTATGQSSFDSDGVKSVSIYRDKSTKKVIGMKLSYRSGASEACTPDSGWFWNGWEIETFNVPADERLVGMRGTVYQGEIASLSFLTQRIKGYSYLQDGKLRYKSGVDMINFVRKRQSAGSLNYPPLTGTSLGDAYWRMFSQKSLASYQYNALIQRLAGLLPTDVHVYETVSDQLGNLSSSSVDDENDLSQAHVKLYGETHMISAMLNFAREIYANDITRLTRNETERIAQDIGNNNSNLQKVINKLSEMDSIDDATYAQKQQEKMHASSSDNYNPFAKHFKIGANFDHRYPVYTTQEYLNWFGGKIEFTQGVSPFVYTITGEINGSGDHFRKLSWANPIRFEFGAVKGGKLLTTPPEKGAASIQLVVQVENTNGIKYKMIKDTTDSYSNYRRDTNTPYEFVDAYYIQAKAELSILNSAQKLYNAYYEHCRKERNDIKILNATSVPIVIAPGSSITNPPNMVISQNEVPLHEERVNYIDNLRRGEQVFSSGCVTSSDSFNDETIFTPYEQYIFKNDRFPSQDSSLRYLSATDYLKDAAAIKLHAGLLAGFQFSWKLPENKALVPAFFSNLPGTVGSGFGLFAGGIAGHAINKYQENSSFDTLGKSMQLGAFLGRVSASYFKGKSDYFEAFTGAYMAIPDLKLRIKPKFEEFADIPIVGTYANIEGVDLNMMKLFRYTYLFGAPFTAQKDSNSWWGYKKIDPAQKKLFFLNDSSI